MITENQKKELDAVTTQPFSFSRIFKNWYADRYGKTAGVRKLYDWAAAKNLIIARFNQIPKSQSRLFIVTPRGADYLVFETETINGNEKKGFQVALIISLFNISAVEKEVGTDVLKFEKSFRLDGGEVVETTA